MSDSFLPANDAFPAADLDRWRALAEATLKGGTFESRLVARTVDGLRIDPLYTPTSAAGAIADAGDVGASPFTRGGQRPGGGWVIAQRVDLADPADANRQILTDLENGVSGLVIVAGNGGVRLDTAADVERLLDGVLTDLVTLTLDAGPAARRIGALILAALQRRGPLSDMRFCMGLDPIGAMARAGGAVMPGPDIVAAALADILRALDDRGLIGPALLLDGRPVADAGGSEAQELAYVLAAGLQYLRWLEPHGIDIADALARMAAKVTLDADQFLSIAKLRALRTLWGRLTETLGAPRLIEIRAESAARMLTQRDPWVNLLRSTVACFAGAVGGADEVTLLPFTAALGVPDGFARRLARNTQAILMEESGLGRVLDPAGGSAYVETLTQDLAAKAWALFQEIERDGGLLASLQSGAWQARIAATRNERAAAIARRKVAITGVSEFPNLAEAAVAVLPAAPAPTTAASAAPRPWPQPGDGAWFAAQIDAAAAGASAADLGLANEGSIALDPLPVIRFAEPFEALRDAADAHAGRTGRRESVFLAALGTPAETTARATFAKNVLEAGGFAAPGNDGFATVEVLTAGFAASGASIACLCSTDEVYAAQAEAAARALKAAGAAIVLLAGNPGERRAALEAAGIDLFIHAGMDVVALLGALQARAGIAPSR